MSIFAELKELGATEMGDRVPEYVTRQRAATELCMSDDTFDKYVRAGILPSPKRRGKLTRWKWSEIVAVLDGGHACVVPLAQDAFEMGIKRVKATNP
jgi:predicted DNA-binding transcriptional regulator AlpA